MLVVINVCRKLHWVAPSDDKHEYRQNVTTKTNRNANKNKTANTDEHNIWQDKHTLRANQRVITRSPPRVTSTANSGI